MGLATVRPFAFDGGAQRGEEYPEGECAGESGESNQGESGGAMVKAVDTILGERTCATGLTAA